jgi:toxin ParE1/3/4
MLNSAQRPSLLDLYDYIAVRDGAARAIGYIGRIEDCCRSLASFPERGIRREDLRSGLWILGFERRAGMPSVSRRIL